MTLASIVLLFHMLVCFMIVGLVLLQRGKGADAGTGFGAGASGTVFGSRGTASFLSRTTAALATTFFVTSLALAFFANDEPEDQSLVEGVAPSSSEPEIALPPGDEVQDESAPPAGDSTEPLDIPGNN